MSIHVLEAEKFCSHCRKDIQCRVSDDILFKLHWKDEFMIFDVILLVPLLVPKDYLFFVLYREIYALQ